MGVAAPKTLCLESDVSVVDGMFVDVFRASENGCVNELLGDLDDARAPKGEADELASAAKPDDAKVFEGICVDCPKG